MKCKSLKRSDVQKIIDGLKVKSENVKWGDEHSKEFVLIGKKIDGKEDLQRGGQFVFDVEDVVVGA